jgi:N6-L-threonylcarbamoyladenine synthase
MTRILGIETSCDETAAAVVEDGRVILSNIIASQVELHARYGGVFPEVASRAHVEAIIPTITRAMNDAHVGWEDLDAIAVTRGPGLAGSLLVGVNAAKGLALGQGLPLVGVNHLEGHVYSLWLVQGAPDVRFPVLCLIVSGGHTELVLMTDHGQYRRLGGTIDDAAGEAFDKVARLLRLGYPGGPAIEQAAQWGNHNAFNFTRARTEGEYDFSFSGLKTAVLREVQRYGPVDMSAPAAPASPARSAGPPRASDVPVADLAASFQDAAVDMLVEKAVAAAEAYEVSDIFLAGGVSANKALRQAMSQATRRPVRYPPLILCTDNAAMIAACGYFRYQAGQRDSWDLDVVPNLKLTA